MINYKKIIEELEDEKVCSLLDSLDIPYKNEDTYILMPTVCHNENPDEASWKLYYYKDSHMFMCYTSCQNMSIFKFLQNFYETRGLVYDWKKDILQVVLKCSASTLEIKDSYRSMRDRYKLQNKNIELQTYNAAVLGGFEKYYPIEWLEDGISKESMDKFNIRFSISQNKIIIPHYNINGELVGIRGRALNPQDVELFGKYMPVQIEGQWYSHPLSLNLYGLNINKENIRRDGIAILVESEKAVMQADQFSIPNYCVAVCGSRINKFHINLLLRTVQPRQIVVAFDNEEEQKSHLYFDKLYKMCEKYKDYCNMSFIYDRDGLTKLKDSPTDKGEAIFEELLKKRVVVK